MYIRFIFKYCRSLQGLIWGGGGFRGAAGTPWAPLGVQENPLWIWSGRIFKMLLLSNDVAATFFTFWFLFWNYFQNTYIFSCYNKYNPHISFSSFFGFGWGIYKEKMEIKKLSFSFVWKDNLYIFIKHLLYDSFLHICKIRQINMWCSSTHGRTTEGGGQGSEITIFRKLSFSQNF